MLMTLQGKIALVTGASRGIGRAIAICLAQAGADVAVNYAGNAQAAQETAEAVRAAGRKAILLQADVGNAEEAESIIKQTVEQFGRLDILVNNAGITRDNLLMRMKEEEFDQVINTNLKGVFNCMKAAARPMMKQRFGRIINISSVVGAVGNPGQVNYVAAKAGVIGMTKTAAKELASRGITVNCVAPGFIATEMTEQLSEETRQQLLSQIPLARLGEPEDIARIVKVLASDDAAYMTGQTIHVDGGMYMG
jgi:3-oxoacyl-[acyl-carrier protein] reductase